MAEKEYNRDRKSQITQFKAADRTVIKEVQRKHKNLSFALVEVLAGVHVGSSRGWCTVVELCECLSLEESVIRDRTGDLMRLGYLSLFEAKRSMRRNKLCLTTMGHLVIKMYNRIMINGLDRGEFKYNVGLPTAAD